jgi:hypothetical protein
VWLFASSAEVLSVVARSAVPCHTRTPDGLGSSVSRPRPLSDDALVEFLEAQWLRLMFLDASNG